MTCVLRSDMSLRSAHGNFRVGRFQSHRLAKICMLTPTVLTISVKLNVSGLLSCMAYRNTCNTHTLRALNAIPHIWGIDVWAASKGLTSTFLVVPVVLILENPTLLKRLESGGLLPPNISSPGSMSVDEVLLICGQYAFGDDTRMQKLITVVQGTRA